MKPKKVLFLFPYPHGTAASQRFRFEQYLVYIEKEGFEYKLQAFLDNSTWAILYKPKHYFQKTWGVLKGFLKRFLMLFTLYKYDFVFIHREASPIGPPVFEWLIARVFRRKIIFDFDDAIWLANTSQENTLSRRLKFHSKTSKICSWAYKISTGNTYLAHYAKQFSEQVIINPTTIDTENLHNKAKSHIHTSKRIIGWTGTHSTIKYLEEILPILQKLEKKYDFEFVVISDKKPDFELKSLKFLAWNKNTEIEDLLRMNFGIMPLKDDKWARGKCGFKALQYMALGIPAVVSPIGVNTDIVDEGKNGFFAVESKDWEKILEELMKMSSEQLQTIGENARAKIIRHYSVTSNQSNFKNLFSK